MGAKTAVDTDYHILNISFLFITADLTLRHPWLAYQVPLPGSYP